ncbi:MAG: glycosyltransferase [bacterium]|nr:glycosyltransferase [bacterium]
MNLYRGLTMLGNDVYVITTDHREKTDAADTHIIRLEGFDVPLKNFDGFQLVPAANKYYKLVKEMNFDIIHVHTEFSIGRFGIRCAKKYKIPYVYTMHTMYEDYMHFVIKFGKPLLKKPYLAYIEGMMRWICKKSSAIVIPHEKVRDMFIRYDLSKDNKIHVIPTGIDLDKFYRKRYSEEEIQALKDSLGLKDEFVILSVGRVAFEKSIDFMIKEYNQFARSVKAKFVIVGDGPAMESLKALVAELKLEDYVIFTGMVPYTNIGLYYMIGDIFVNASVTETQGLTYIEALSSNLPVVVRYDKNLDGLITDRENGLFYNTPDEFKDKVIEIINDKKLLMHLKENAYKTAKVYSKQNYAETINNLYKSILEKKK